MEREADTRKKDEPELRSDPVDSDSADSYPGSDPPPPQRGRDADPKPEAEQEEGEEQDA